MPTAEQNEAGAREFMDRVFNQRDLDYAERSLTEEFIERNPFTPDMGNDRNAAMATFRMIHSMSSDITFEVLDLVATEDRVAIRSIGRGTDDGVGWGSPMGAPATGKPFSVEGIDVVGVAPDGRYTEHYGLSDVMGLMGQLGLMPGPEQS